MWGHVIPSLASPTALSLPSDALVSLLAVPLLAKLLQPNLLQPALLNPPVAPLQPHQPHAASSNPAQQHFANGGRVESRGTGRREEAEVCTAVLRHAVVITANGSRIRLRPSCVSNPASGSGGQGERVAESRNVYLPVSLGGAADWDSEFPEACFEVLCGSYSQRFPQLRDQWRWVGGRRGWGVHRAGREGGGVFIRLRGKVCTGHGVLLPPQLCARHRN